MSNVAPASYPTAERPYGSEPIARLKKWRTRIKWASGVLLALDVLALLFALSFANITASGPAHRGLEHSVAILTEIDTYLDLHYDDLQVQATLSQQGTIDLPGFPIPISIKREDILHSNREQFRETVLSKSASAVHKDGVSVLRGSGTSETPFFSTQGAVRSSMELLRPTPHRFFRYVTFALAFSGAGLALALVLSAGGSARLLALSFSLLASTLPFLIFAIAARFALQVAADGADDALSKEFFTLAQELSWALIRNGIIFVAGSALLFASGAFLARWDGERLRRA